MDSWKCNGEAKDGRQHSNQNPVGVHEPYENYGADCVICNLTREQAIGGQKTFPITILILSSIILAILGAGAWAVFRTCPSGQTKIFGMICQPIQIADEPYPNELNPAPPTDIVEIDPNNRDESQGLLDRNRVYTWEPERFSWGNRTLFSGDSNVPRSEGIEAFNNGNYQAAADSFKRAVAGNRNDPEVLIFYNNALARQRGNPFTLAVVVPVDGRRNSAQEMLRGVAQAQNNFNAAGGLDNERLLEIVIANDGNNAENAARVAGVLVNDQSVLGVIGHNSSSASKAALSVYERFGLPMISPTSTSTELDSAVFFRTVPSDAAAAEVLAQYARSVLDVSKVVIFYNPESSFSNSLQAAFEARFTQLGGVSISKDLSLTNLDAGIEVASAAFEEQAEAMLLFPDTDYTSVAIELAKANARLSMNTRLKLLGGDSLYSIETITAGGDSVEGLVVPVSWFAGDPQFIEFSQVSSQQWGGPVSWRTAMSFDATQAFLSVLADDASRGSVLQRLGQVILSSGETSGQELRFTSEGNRESDPILVHIVRGSRNKVPGSDFGYELIP